MRMDFYETTLAGLRRAVDAQQGNVAKLAGILGVEPNLLSRWLNRDRVPRLDKLGPILDKLGAEIVFQDENKETIRPVQFAEPRIVGIEEYAKVKDARVHVSEDHYAAVPLVPEAVAAGPGLMAHEHEVHDWVVVDIRQEAIRFKTSLLAFRIGRGQNSMVPTLNPEDIVIIDKSDRDPWPEGKIMLVCEPGETGEPTPCMVKRVAAHRKDHDLEFVFYSDNGKEYPPRTYLLERDYAGDVNRAIAGRVIWAWSDMTRK